MDNYYSKLSRLELAERGLYKQAFQVTLLANALTAGEFPVIAQRGDVRAVSLVCAGGTELEYIKVRATISDNGRSFIDKDTLLPYSSFYRTEQKSVVPVFIRQKGIVGFTFQNDNDTVIEVSIELYFYDPWSNYLRE